MTDRAAPDRAAAPAPLAELIDEAAEHVRHAQRCPANGRGDEHCDCGAVDYIARLRAALPTLLAALDGREAGRADGWRNVKRDAWNEAIEAAQNAAEDEVARHNTGSGFDSNSAYVASCRISNAIRALARPQPAGEAGDE